jgi:hypothetical protein
VPHGCLSPPAMDTVLPSLTPVSPAPSPRSHSPGLLSAICVPCWVQVASVALGTVTSQKPWLTKKKQKKKAQPGYRGLICHLGRLVTRCHLPA